MIEFLIMQVNVRDVISNIYFTTVHGYKFNIKLIVDFIFAFLWHGVLTDNNHHCIAGTITTP